MLSEILSLLPWPFQTVLSPYATYTAAPQPLAPLEATPSCSPSPPPSRCQSPPPDDAHSGEDHLPIQPDQLLPVPGASCPFPLPQPSYARRNGELLQGFLGNGVWKVEYQGNRMILKGGPGITKSEAEMTEFVRARTTIPVSKVYGVVREGDSTFIFFEFIEGTPLNHLFDEPDPAFVDAICQQLRRMLDQLHALLAPPGTAIGSLDGSNIFALGPRRDDTALRNVGRPNSAGALIDLLHSRYLTCEGATEQAWREVEAHLNRSAPLVFIHGDIHEANILIAAGQDGCSRIVALLDWEMAGYYPEWMEYPAVERRADASAMATALMKTVCGRATGFSDDAADYEWIAEMRGALLCSGSLDPR